MPARRYVLGLLRACHPGPALAVTTGAALLAVGTGRDAAGVAAVALTVGASQLAGGWHNDWVDAPRDVHAGRRDKPLVTGDVPRRAVGYAAAAAAVVTVASGFLSGPRAGLVAMVALCSCLAYNWPLKSTALSVMPYIVSFGALPAFVVLGLPGSPSPPWWLVAAGAAVGISGHLANVLSDLEDDATTGVRGLPHRLGPVWSTVVADAVLAFASVLLVLGPPGPPTTLALAGLGLVVAILLAGAYGQRMRPTSRLAFASVIVAALINVVLLLGAVSLV